MPVMKHFPTPLRLLVLPVLVSLAACSDGAVAPLAPVAALIQEQAGNGQTAEVGTAVIDAPAVIVRDGHGTPIPGILVQFEVTVGAGAVGVARATTDAAGMASAGAWTLGPVAGENRLEARVGTLAPVEFTATGVDPAAPEPPVVPPAPPPGPVAGGFSIDIRYVGALPTLRQQQAVTGAVARWRTVIVADLPGIPVTAPAAACFAGQPALSEWIDDLLIFVEFVAIDGPGRILGSAGPCYIRRDSNLPVVGYMKLDTADLQQMERAGTLDDVVLHEMGHVLGIGTLWETAGLLTGGGTDDPQFAGSGALSEFVVLGGTGSGVPVENTGGAGTRDGHWRESVFGNELMTGYIGGVPNPLSGLTVASLRDLGYGATFSAAATYTLGGTSGWSVTQPVDLRDRETMLEPRFRVDRVGRTERIPPKRGPAIP